MFARVAIRIALVLLGALATPVMGQADGYIREGDRHFQQMAYARAVASYRVAAELGAVNEHVTKRLAECLMILGQMEEAEKWYAIVVKYLNREPRDLYNYAEVLKSNGRYEEAEEWMDRYLATKAGDGPLRSNIGGFARKFAQEEERFRIKPVSINTEWSDFGTAWLDAGRVLFVSARSQRVIMHRRAAWNGEPFLDLYVADVGEGGDLTDPRKLEGAVNSINHEGPATASTEGDVLWFTRNSSQRSGQGISRLGLFTAQRDGQGFGRVEPFLYNNSEVSNGHPALSPDGQRLYFVSDMPGGYGGTDIYVVHQQGGQWGEPENLGPTINTPYNEVFPFVAADGTLYFASNGHPGLGGLDVNAARPDGNGGFRSPINVGAPVNGPRDDFAFIIDPTGTRGFFSSNRPGGRGSDDIYGFVMLAPLEQRFMCTGTVIDEEHDIPVIAAEVLLYNKDGALIATTLTDARGEYSFTVDKDREYRLVAKLKDRFDGEQFLSTDRIEQEQIITRDIRLVADAGIWLRGTARPSDRPGFLSGMTVSVVNLSSFHTETKVTGPGGDFSFRMQGNEEFEVLLEMSGYYSLSVPVSTIGMRQGIIDLNEARELVFDPMVVGKPVAFKHIRWERGRSVLDPVARTEVDALAERMLVNPGILVEVAVHADARGEEDQKLTQKRADAIVEYLRGKGIPKERLVARGYGATRLLNHCAPGVTCTEEEHAVNRRNEYVVTEIRP